MKLSDLCNTGRVHYQLNGLVPVSVCKHMYMTLAYRQFAHDPKKYGCYRHLLVT
jgi:hypothetical protein